MKCIVLNVNPYRFANENGEVVEGVNVQYLYAETLDPVAGINGALGLSVLKQSFPIAKLADFGHAPALYDFTFDSRVVNGKMTFVPTDVKFVSDLVLSAGK